MVPYWHPYGSQSRVDSSRTDHTTTAIIMSDPLRVKMTVSSVATPLAPAHSRLHEIVFVFVLCLAQFLSLAGMNQTVAPMLILAKYFDIHDYGNLSWFSAAYSMTVGTFILPAGQFPTLP